MSYNNTKYKYIFPHPSVYDDSIDIESVLKAMSCEADNHGNLCCPNGHRSKHKLTIHTRTRKGTNTCHCHNCGEFNGGPYRIAKWYKGGSSFEAKKWLSETFGIEKVLNPDYVSPRGYTLTEEELRLAQEQMKKIQQAKSIETEIKVKEIEYLIFDESIKYNYIKNIKEFFPNTEDWKSFNAQQRLRVVYTWFYNRSFELGSNKAKYGYYKNRGIDTENKWLKRIGYLAVEDFDTILKEALEIFPTDILVLVGLIKEDDSEIGFKLSFSYVKKGGLLLVPSFDLYSNTVTGFMLRPTHPEQWMKDSHMKEIQLSNTAIIFPLPFGLTYSSIKNHNVFYGTEGHPDAVALPGNVEGEEDRAFFSLPGVNGLDESHLGLLRGKEVIICYDQDAAGKKAAFGYSVIDVAGIKETYILGKDDLAKKMRIENLQKYNKTFVETNYEGIDKKLEKAGVSYKIKEWDIKIGSDVNDVRMYGNLNKIF